MLPIGAGRGSPCSPHLPISRLLPPWSRRPPPRALAEVHDQIADLISAQSWADVVAQLREHAADLSSSAIARNQLKARALEVAADNLVGGRAAFTDWPAFFSAELQPGP